VLLLFENKIMCLPNYPSPDYNGKLFAKAVLVFLVAKKRPEEALLATLEKQTDLQKLVMESWK
jgi:hypothetical protein